MSKLPLYKFTYLQEAYESIIEIHKLAFRWVGSGRTNLKLDSILDVKISIAACFSSLGDIIWFDIIALINHLCRSWESYQPQKTAWFAF